MAKPNDEMSILGSDEDSMPDQDQDQPLTSAAPDQEADQMVSIKQSDLKAIQDGLTQASALVSQYVQPETEEEGMGEQESPEPVAPDSEESSAEPEPRGDSAQRL